MEQEMIIRGLKFSSNTRKVLFVSDAVGAKYEYIEMDLRSGEQRTPEHFARHPFGKVPTLTHFQQGVEKHLFESGAICRYLASVQRSDLYPVSDHYLRCQVDQWLDFFTVHLGRWVNSYVFQKVIKQRMEMGDPDLKQVDEAKKYIDQQCKSLNHHLEGKVYLTENYSIADIFAYAYVEYAQVAGLDLGKDLSNIKSWIDVISSKDSIQRTKEKF